MTILYVGGNTMNMSNVPLPNPPVNETPIIELVNTNDIVTSAPIQCVQSIRDDIDSKTVDSSSNLTPVTTTITTTSLPVRYGIAAMIPYDDEFDLQSVLNAKSSIPFSNQANNDLLMFLQNEKSKKPIIHDSQLHDLLKDNSRDRDNLVQVARKAQQDFLDAIQLY